MAYNYKQLAGIIAMTSTGQLGKIGEDIAADYLRKKGYRILGRNFVFRIPGSPQKGELDIVAEKEKTISFVEVKTLKGEGLFLPEDRVGYLKKRRLRRSAEAWLIKNKIPLNSRWQIDVISVRIREGEKAEINHFENAFGYE